MPLFVIKKQSIKFCQSGTEVIVMLSSRLVSCCAVVSSCCGRNRSFFASSQRVPVVQFPEAWYPRNSLTVVRPSIDSVLLLSALAPQLFGFFIFFAVPRWAPLTLFLFGSVRLQLGDVTRAASSWRIVSWIGWIYPFLEWRASIAQWCAKWPSFRVLCGY